jgi:hypothetical protein
VDAGQIEQLPDNGREWRSLELLTPAANDAGDAQDGGVLASYRGLAPSQNESLVDGVSDEQSFRSGPRGLAGGSARAEYMFSSEAVREFHVSAQDYSAQAGRGVGGSIRMVSRSGSNGLHGSAQYLLRSSALAAMEPFSIASYYRDGAITSEYVKPHDLRHQAAASLGGALRHDRLFYLYVFDGMHRGFPGISAPGYAGFYALTATQRALLANRGVSTTQTNAALNYLDSLTGTVTRAAGRR